MHISAALVFPPGSRLQYKLHVVYVLLKREDMEAFQHAYVLL